MDKTVLFHDTVLILHHTHAHTVLMAIFQVKPGLAGCHQ